MTHDDLDKQIINTPLDDGRASLHPIAGELDVVVTTVSNYLGELEDDDVIQGYVPRLNYEKLGYGMTATFQLKVQSESLPEVTDRLVEQDQLISVYEVTGYYDVVAIGKFTNTDEMNAQTKALLPCPPPRNPIRASACLLYMSIASSRWTRPKRLTRNRIDP